MSAHPIFQRLFSDMASVGLIPDALPLSDVPKPIAPQPLYPVREVPADRSDFTKDDEATGV